MKKKIAFVLALVIAVSCILAGCGNSSSSKTTTSAKKTFTVGFDASFPPYGYKDDNGNYVGFDIDLAKEVCKRNGWTIKLQPIDWDSKDMELNSGTIDCIWNGFTINGREDDYTWSDPYVDNTQVVVVKKDSGITKLSDLSGKIVAVQTDSSALSALQDTDNKDMVKLTESFKKLDIEQDYLTAFSNLDAGSVDAVAIDIGVAQHEIAQKGADKYVILDETISSEKYGVGFKKGNTALRDKVQKTLDAMMKDGTFLKIAKKWGLEDSVIIKGSTTTTTTAAATATTALATE
jgi:polar amino acid transport system substrate-binding protein